MKHQVWIVVLLVILSGCGGVFDGNKTVSPGKETTSSAATGTPSTKINNNTDFALSNINIQTPATEDYDLLKSTTSDRVDLNGTSATIRKHKLLFGRNSTTSSRPRIFESVVILTKSEKTERAKKAILRERNYNKTINTDMNQDIVTMQYTSPAGFNATIAVGSYRNVIVYTVELGGGDYYTNFVKRQTIIRLERAQSVIN